MNARGTVGFFGIPTVPMSVNKTTPCDEINIELVFKISQQLEGVRSSPAGFGLLSEGTYLSSKDFEKSF